ncbi:MAG: PqqD family peptide modification chaperone [Burkholderiales bacterium]
MRGQRWYLLVNVVNGRQYRINERAYQFIGRCDGRRSVEEVWSSVLEELGDGALAQGEVIQSLNRLYEHDLITYETPPDTHTFVRQGAKKTPRGIQRLVNPFALRIPLGDPSWLLRHLDPFARFVFNRVTLSLWLVVVVGASLTAASNWRALSSHAVSYMGTPRYLFLAWISFPFIKTLHELGHALALGRWGGETHEIGFSLFVLVPAPYVDASAAAAFPSRTQRVIVGAAGIMVELALAAVALSIWINVQPGVVRDLAFVTMFIASISTVVFNGNPLLQFDAYYVMSDALDLPNLASRSKAWWTQQLLRGISSDVRSEHVQAANGERKWLFAYAPAAFTYRLVVSFLLVLWLGAHSAVLGAIGALFLIVVLIIKPAFSSLAQIWAAASIGGARVRGALVCATAGCLIIGGICVVPVPFHTVASGVVWPPEQARVRPATDGFVRQVLARDGEQVITGQVLLVLDDPNLVAQRNILTSRLEQLQAARFSALLDSYEQVRNAEEESARVQSELQRVEDKIEHLKIRAHAEGRLVMPHQEDLADSFVRQGSTLGYVLARAQIGVRAVIPEYDVSLVRDYTRGVQVRLADCSEVAGAELVRDIPAATYDLPSAALGDRGGGVLVTDPADKDGLRTREPVVVLDVKLPGTELERVGGRAWVRFDHGAQPLASRWYRQLRQVLLQHFNPAA